MTTTATATAAAFADLPIGLVWQIAEFLPVRDVNAWKSTCSYWNRTLRIDRFLHPCSGCKRPTNTPFCTAGRDGIRCFFCRQPVATIASFANDLVADLQFPECAQCHGERRVCPGCDKFLVGADPSSHYKACFLVHPAPGWSATRSGSHRRYRQMRQWKDRWSHLQALPCQQSDQQQNTDGLSRREEKTMRSITTTTGFAPSPCEKNTAAMEQNDVTVDATTATTTRAQLSSEKRKEQVYDRSQWAADFNDMVLIRKVHERYRKEK